MEKLFGNWSGLTVSHSVSRLVNSTSWLYFDVEKICTLVTVWRETLRQPCLVISGVVVVPNLYDWRLRIWIFAIYNRLTYQIRVKVVARVLFYVFITMLLWPTPSSPLSCCPCLATIWSHRKTINRCMQWKCLFVGVHEGKLGIVMY